MKETWKTIDGFKIYEVSNTGKVRNKKTKRLIKGEIQKGGYIRLSLWNDEKKHKHKLIQRLVAEAFIENHSEQRIYVNHIDGNKNNNNVSNLEWVTNKENLTHSIKVLKQHIKPLRCVETGETFESILAASQAYKVDRTNISKCCNGKLKSAGRYHWEFIK